MKGQWIGTYTGSVEGKLMINIDEVDIHYEAVVYVNPVDPRNDYQCKGEDIKGLYPEGVTHSDQAEVSLHLINGKLNIYRINKSI